MLYLLLTVQYDGTNYRGWVKQKNARTIQNELESAFFRVCQQNVWMLGASKTDAGVHALDQKVLVRLEFTPKDIAYFIKTISKSLNPDINIKSYQIVDENFGVRNCIEKEYIYTINDSEYDLFNHRYELHLGNKLEIDRLQSIANLFIGEHNFINFSTIKPEENINPIRLINSIKIYRDEKNKIKISVRGKAFIRYQIRMIVGAILQCYHNKITIEDIKDRLKNKDNNKPKYCAPAQGLCLVKIIYKS